MIGALESESKRVDRELIIVSGDIPLEGRFEIARHEPSDLASLSGPPHGDPLTFESIARRHMEPGEITPVIGM